MVDTQEDWAGFDIIVEERDRGLSSQALASGLNPESVAAQVPEQMLKVPVERFPELEFVEHPRFQHPRFQHRYLSPAGLSRVELSPPPRRLPLLRPGLLPWLDSDSRGFQLKKWIPRR